VITEPGARGTHRAGRGGACCRKAFGGVCARLCVCSDLLCCVLRFRRSFHCDASCISVCFVLCVCLRSVASGRRALAARAHRGSPKRPCQTKKAQGHRWTGAQIRSGTLRRPRASPLLPTSLLPSLPLPPPLTRRSSCRTRWLRPIMRHRLRGRERQRRSRRGASRVHSGAAARTQRLFGQSAVYPCLAASLGRWEAQAGSSGPTVVPFVTDTGQF
jgi:hypothetical protein